MDNKNIGLYLSRILSGFYIFNYNNTRYKLVYPDISIKYEAELYAKEEYENNKFNNWIKEEEIVYILTDIGVWNPRGDQQLKNMEKEIDDYKVDLYKSSLNPNKVKSLRQTLSNIKKAYYKNTETRHSLDHLTIEGFSTILKNQYILVNSIRNMDGSLLFNNLKETDYNILNKISTIINNNIIEMSKLKQIARSDIWRNYWSANKENIFNKGCINLTDEQKSLIVVTKMYDSAYDHPDCPSDNIIEDDDMFDGWMISQRKENEAIKNKNRAEKLLDGKNLGNAQEVFLMADSKEEADNIYNLNDNRSKHIINERNAVVLNSKQEISDNNLPDVQRNLQMESNRQFLNRGK
jgi:hypothetical protein